VEPDAVAGPQESVVGLGDLEQADPATWSHDAAELAEHLVQLGEVAKGVSAGDPVDRAAGQRKPRPVSLRQGRTAAIRGQHPPGQVHPELPESSRPEDLQEVSGPAGQVEHQ
jgi:hypothetical protein